MGTPLGTPLRGHDPDEEFERLILPGRSRMMRAIWRVVRDPELAEEAFQDALTTLWRKLAVLRAHPNPQAFILRVCLDAACDQVRARGRRASRFVGIDETNPRRAVVSGETVENAAFVGEVIDAVGRLRPRQATALLLRALHEAPYDVIAQALGCSEATARVHVQRARDSVRSVLGLGRPSNKGPR